ncbi:MAG: hypothetical protein HZB51_15835 [Chloroflexi bacterium]|nr:hypothetical protein [Chloroflexota bacterium]
MPRQVNQDALTQSWIHSHEEDTETQMVFRPATFKFPPSRGRTGFELKAGGKLINRGIAPTDEPSETSGSWALENDNTLNFYLGAKKKPTRSLKIVSADKSRLVIEK